MEEGLGTKGSLAKSRTHFSNNKLMRSIKYGALLHVLWPLPGLAVHLVVTQPEWRQDEPSPLVALGLVWGFFQQEALLYHRLPREGVGT